MGPPVANVSKSIAASIYLILRTMTSNSRCDRITGRIITTNMCGHYTISAGTGIVRGSGVPRQLH